MTQAIHKIPDEKRRRIRSTGPLCVLFYFALVACVQSGTGDHVALDGKPDTVERTTPTWVAEFSAGARPNAADTKDGADQPTGRPHVILVSLDTLRADHLGAWGYDRPTSPFLDALAQNGALFKNVFSQSPKTAPSHMSLFTGTYPSQHGAHFEYETQPPTVHPVGPDLELLPEIMHSAGYRTAAWTGGGQVSGTAGFARGFDRFSEDLGDIEPRKMEGIRTWFRDNSDQPCFLFLHTYQIHDPYLPPSPYNEVFASDYGGWIVGDKKRLLEEVGENAFGPLHRAFWRKVGLKPNPELVKPDDLEYLEALYDGGIRYTDDVLHGFFDALLFDGLLENTLVIVFSDHGEEFLDHGGLLHETLYRETLHVPLILFWPAGLPGGIEIDSQAPLIDLGPTLLELVGIEAVRHEGSSLVPLFEIDTENPGRPVFSEEPWVHAYPHRSLRDGSHTFYDHGGGKIELFSTDRDPAELNELSMVDPRMASEMHAFLLDFIAARASFPNGNQPEARDLSAEEIEKLRALGYVE